jgi:ABC-2 type transport system permease protein
LEPLLDDGQVVLGVVIPHGTAAGVAAGRQAPVAVVVDGTNAQISTTASNYAVQIIQTFNSQLASQNGASLAYPRIDARVRVVANPTLAVVNAMIPGLIALIMMMTLMIIMSMAVVREREAGTLEQMFTTPIRPGEYLAGKVAPYAVIAVAQSAIVGVLGTWWFGVPFAGNIWVLATGLALFLLVAIGLGLLISLVSSNRQQAIQTCVFTLIPFIVLSGWVFPIESMPEAFQPVTQAIPLAHMIEILRSTFMKQSGFADMAYPLLMLAGMAVVFFSSAVAATHYRLREA